VPLHRAKVYRNAELRQQWLGLEPLDATGLLALFWALQLLTDRIAWNLVALVAGYLALRLWKRNKPEGYTTSVLRFHLRRPFFSAAATDEKSVPFPITAGDVRPRTTNRS
jgi:hypothetical protein